VILLLCPLSEIELQSRLRLMKRIEYVWAAVTRWFIAGKDVYERRYAGHL
jgi:hypothetical protein